MKHFRIYDMNNSYDIRFKTILLTLLLLMGVTGAEAADYVTVSSVEDLNNVADKPGGDYQVTADFDASSFNKTITFKGTFDGGYHTISGLRQPLFTTVSGGTVKNVRLSNVNIDNIDIDNAGAVCGTATDSAKIYNCGVLSGSVSGSETAGGLDGRRLSGKPTKGGIYIYKGQKIYIKRK